MSMLSTPLYSFRSALAVGLVNTVVLGSAFALARPEPPPVASPPRLAAHHGGTTIPAPIAAPVRRAVAAPAVRHVTRPKAPQAAPPSTPRKAVVKAHARQPRPARIGGPARPPRPAPAPAARVLSWTATFSAAVARLPRRAAEPPRWVVSDRYGSWGTADWYRNTVYISPRVPRARLYDVVVHEWSHLQSVGPYGGDIDAAVTAMTGYFGGAGRLTGAERAADCMAVLRGALWTAYTPCSDERRRAGARRLLSGRHL